jgi:hypothetical protein
VRALGHSAPVLTMTTSVQPTHPVRCGPRPVRLRLPGRLHLFHLNLPDGALVQAKTAWDLKKVWPELELHIVPDAGHYSRETGVAKLLVEVRPAPSTSDVPRSSQSTGSGQVLEPLRPIGHVALIKPSVRIARLPTCSSSIYSISLCVRYIGTTAGRASERQAQQR